MLAARYARAGLSSAALLASGPTRTQRLPWCRSTTEHQAVGTSSFSRLVSVLAFEPRSKKPWWQRTLQQLFPFQSPTGQRTKSPRPVPDFVISARTSWPLHLACLHRPRPAPDPGSPHLRPGVTSGNSAAI